MSEDTSYEMQRAGKKVRCLMVPFGEHRNLAGIRTVEEFNRTVQDGAQALKAAAADAERRVTALERKRDGTDDDLPEYSVTVDRARGVVGGDR